MKDPVGKPHLSYPTELISILEPKNPSIDVFVSIQKCLVGITAVQRLKHMMRSLAG